MQFTSAQSAVVWTLVVVYGPCQGQERDDFATWLNASLIPSCENWMLLGDFNFYRSLENRNRPGRNLNDMVIFDTIICNLGLVELPIKGRRYTWSNMQDEPLLEQLDWFFTSNNWTISYPNTLVKPLARDTSDHIPCVVSIETRIPKANIFRFEKFLGRAAWFF